MVCGWRQNRQDPWLRRLSARIANSIRGRVLGDGFHDTACSLRVFRRECVQGLVMFHGMHRFLPALVKMAGYQVGEVVVRHHPRKYGEAKYNVRNRIWRALMDLFGVVWLRSRRIGYEITGEE
jgi:dolichol-phosphate mannosyltransferase